MKHGLPKVSPTRIFGPHGYRTLGASQSTAILTPGRSAISKTERLKVTCCFHSFQRHSISSYSISRKISAHGSSVHLSACQQTVSVGDTLVYEGIEVNTRTHNRKTHRTKVSNLVAPWATTKHVRPGANQARAASVSGIISTVAIRQHN